MFLKNKKLDMLVWLLILFPVIYPSSLDTLIPSGRVIFSTLAIVSFMICILIYVVCIKKDLFVFLIIVYCVEILSSTVLNKGEVFNVLVSSTDFSIMKLLTICMALTICFRKKTRVCCDILLRYYEVIIFLNFCTIVLFPGGMYSTGQNENYFLGFDNTHSVVFFFALGLAFLNDYIDGRSKFSRRTWVMIVLVHLNSILCMSSLTIIQLFLFDVFLIFKKALKDRKLFNGYTLIAVNIAVTIFLLFFFSDKNVILKYIIVNILGKDMTLTFRAYLWSDYVFPAISENIVFGHGWGYENAYYYMHGYYHAHNQYLTDLYYGGIVMLAVLLLITVLVAKKLNKYKTTDTAYYLLVIFFVSMFHWNTESMHLMMQLATFCILYNYDYIVQLRVKNSMTIKQNYKSEYLLSGIADEKCK